MKNKLIMRQQFKTVRFKPVTLDLIEQCNEILDEVAPQSGGSLTLRQLYYQLVSRDVIPNNQREYSKLSDVMNNARLAGLVDWDLIGDRTRNVRRGTNWKSPQSIIDASYYSYRLDKWRNQPEIPEVWIEKDALVGVFEGVCRELDVPLFSCRGYTSISEMYVAANRIRRRTQEHQITFILHFGDHDPSGMDMTRDIQDRLRLLSGRHIIVNRLALNFNQVEQYNPPPNPAKVTDPRASAYRSVYGDSSWELDALTPNVLSTLVREHVLRYRDDDTYNALMAEETEQKEILRKISRNYQQVAEFVADLPHERAEAPPADEMPDCPRCGERNGVFPLTDSDFEYECTDCGELFDEGDSYDEEDED